MRRTRAGRTGPLHGLAVLATILAAPPPAGADRSANPYRVLSLAASAVSDAEIKRAYRRAALAAHPDAGGTAERFREVSDAFAVLKARRRAADVVELVRLPLSIVESDVVVDFSRTAKTRCPACAGMGSPPGSPPPRSCPGCGGAGVNTVRLGCGPGEPCIQFSGPCATCSGSGWLGKRCLVCGGTGVASELRNYEVRFPAQALAGHRLTVVGEGDVSSGKLERPGDLTFEAAMQPHALYERIEGRPKDLHCRLVMDAERLRFGVSLSFERVAGPQSGLAPVGVKVGADHSIVPGLVREFTIPNFTKAGGKLEVELQARQTAWVFQSAT